MAEKMDIPAWFERAMDPSTPTTKDNETMRTENNYSDRLGGEVIYPTIRMNKAGKLYRPKDPMKAAIKSGDYILVEGPPSQETAEKAIAISKRMSDVVAQARTPADVTDRNIKEAEDRMIDQQMKMAFADGGLLDEGGTVDPVSGNDVPAGSTQKEVRDDIPAQLSEGEFVFPADVVRYIGLENLMELRQKAKEGLQQMDDMGQMGNSEEAILDDDIEYNAEIDMLIDGWNPDEGELEMAEGGVVYAQQGALMPQQGATSPALNLPQQNTSFSYQAPTTEQMIFGGGTGAPFSGVQSPVKYTSEEYVGPSGERITVTFINGQPVYPIPEGYKKYDSSKVVKEKPVVEAPKVQPEKDGGDGPPTQSTQTPTLGYSKQQAVGVLNEVNPKLEERYKGLPQGIKGVLTMGLIPSVISAVQYGVEANKAVKQVEQGYKLSSFDPTSEYGKWRSNLDNEYMAAAMLETENEARKIVDEDDDFDVQGSSFGSYEEAEAVANNGWGSDEHFDAIDKDFDNLPEAKPSTGGITVEVVDDDDNNNDDNNNDSDTGISESSGTRDDVENQGGLE